MIAVISRSQNADHPGMTSTTIPATTLTMPKVIAQPRDAARPGLGEGHHTLDDPADPDDGNDQDKQSRGGGLRVLDRDDAGDDQQQAEQDVERTVATTDASAEDAERKAHDTRDQEVDAEEDGENGQRAVRPEEQAGCRGRARRCR